MIKSKRFFIVLVIHIAFWMYDNTVDYIGLEDNNLLDVVVFNLLAFAPFYINYLLLVPKMLKSFNVFRIILWLVTFFVMFIPFRFLQIYIFYSVIYGNAWEYEEFEILKWALVVGIFYCSVSTGTRLLWEWLGNVTESKKLQLQKTQNQLQLLKSKINLLFVMDTLDFLEKKSKSNPSSIQDQIIELSNVMRYNLYNRSHDEILLSEELIILDDQVKLMKSVYNMEVIVNNNTSQDTAVIPGILTKTIFELQQYCKDTFKVEIVSESEKVYAHFHCSHDLTPNFIPDLSHQIKTEIKDNQLIIQLN